jgi:hypothetical protein
MLHSGDSVGSRGCGGEFVDESTHPIVGCWEIQRLNMMDGGLVYPIRDVRKT